MVAALWEDKEVEAALWEDNEVEAAFWEDKEVETGIAVNEAILLIGNHVALVKGFTDPQYWFPTSVTFTLRGLPKSSPEPLAKSSTG